MIIAIDFDGTCVTHDYPNEGQDIGAIPILRELVKNGHQLILYTMRSGIELDSAKQWFLRNDIKLYGVQFNPTQATWTCSNKCYAQLYIDDAALGAPLKTDSISDRPFIDWDAVYEMLVGMGLIKIKTVEIDINDFNDDEPV